MAAHIITTSDLHAYVNMQRFFSSAKVEQIATEQVAKVATEQVAAEQFATEQDIINQITDEEIAAAGADVVRYVTNALEQAREQVAETDIDINVEPELVLANVGPAIARPADTASALVDLQEGDGDIDPELLNDVTFGRLGQLLSEQVEPAAAAPAAEQADDAGAAGDIPLKYLNIIHAIQEGEDLGFYTEVDVAEAMRLAAKTGLIDIKPEPLPLPVYDSDDDSDDESDDDSDSSSDESNDDDSDSSSDDEPNDKPDDESSSSSDSETGDESAAPTTTTVTTTTTVVLAPPSADTAADDESSDDEAETTSTTTVDDVPTNTQINFSVNAPPGANVTVKTSVSSGRTCILC